MCTARARCADTAFLWLSSAQPTSPAHQPLSSRTRRSTARGNPHSRPNCWLGWPSSSTVPPDRGVIRCPTRTTRRARHKIPAAPPKRQPTRAQPHPQTGHPPRATPPNGVRPRAPVRPLAPAPRRDRAAPREPGPARRKARLTRPGRSPHRQGPARRDPTPPPALVQPPAPAHPRDPAHPPGQATPRVPVLREAAPARPLLQLDRFPPRRGRAYPWDPARHREVVRLRKKGRRAHRRGQFLQHRRRSSRRPVPGSRAGRVRRPGISPRSGSPRHPASRAEQPTRRHQHPPLAAPPSPVAPVNGLAAQPHPLKRRAA